MHAFWSLAKAVLSGLKTPRSSGWITSEQWGGKHIISMPFALASCRVWTSRCVLDPSRKSTTVGLGFPWMRNTSKSHSRKTSALLHPFPVARQWMGHFSCPNHSPLTFWVTPEQHRCQGHIGCRYTPYQSNLIPLIPPLPPHLVASPPRVQSLTSVAAVLDLERRLIHVVDIWWVVIDGLQRFLDKLEKKLLSLLGC